MELGFVRKMILWQSRYLTFSSVSNLLSFPSFGTLIVLCVLEQCTLLYVSKPNASQLASKIWLPNVQADSIDFLLWEVWVSTSLKEGSTILFPRGLCSLLQLESKALGGGMLGLHTSHMGQTSTSLVLRISPIILNLCLLPDIWRIILKLNTYSYGFYHI